MLTRKRSKHLLRKLAQRKPNAKVDPHVEEQFLTGRLYGNFNIGINNINWSCHLINIVVALLYVDEVLCGCDNVHYI